MENETRTVRAAKRTSGDVVGRDEKVARKGGSVAATVAYLFSLWPVGIMSLG